MKKCLAPFYGKRCLLGAASPRGGSARPVYVFDATQERRAVKRLQDTHLGDEAIRSPDGGEAVLFMLQPYDSDNEPVDYTRGLRGVMGTCAQVDALFFYDTETLRLFEYQEGTVLPWPKTLSQLDLRVEARPRPTTPKTSRSSARKAAKTKPSQPTFSLHLTKPATLNKTPNRIGGSCAVAPSRWPMCGDQPMRLLLRLATKSLLAAHAGIAIFITGDNTETEPGHTVALALDERELAGRPQNAPPPLREYAVTAFTSDDFAVRNESVLGGRLNKLPEGFRLLAQFNFNEVARYVELGDDVATPRKTLRVLVDTPQRTLRLIWMAGTNAVSSADFAI